MCTVTFIARQRGYCLGMNRDEKLTRPTGLPPKKKTMEGRAVLGPSEPGGGKWIAVNDYGVTLALINWYSITARVGGKAVSRGEVRYHAGPPCENAVIRLAMLKRDA